MGSFGGFYKGDKKKKKKGQDTNRTSYSPVFTPPEILGKVKKEDRG